jgi:hypothetical protein
MDSTFSEWPRVNRIAEALYMGQLVLFVDTSGP